MRKKILGLSFALFAATTAMGFLTLNNSVYASAAAPTAAVTGTAAVENIEGKAELTTFKMVAGASIRKDAPAGIRFATEIDPSELSEVPTGAEFGTLIYPTALLDGADLVAGENVAQHTE